MFHTVNPIVYTTPTDARLPIIKIENEFCGIYIKWKHLRTSEADRWFSGLHNLLRKHTVHATRMRCEKWGRWPFDLCLNTRRIVWIEELIQNRLSILTSIINVLFFAMGPFTENNYKFSLSLHKRSCYHFRFIYGLVCVLCVSTETIITYCTTTQISRNYTDSKVAEQMITNCK